jgi:enoyl-CoA hydratase
MPAPEPIARPTVDVCLEDGVRSVTIRRPPANALSAREYAALRDAFAARDGARVCVLRGSGRIFCAGQDLAEFAALTDHDRGRYLAEAGEAVATAAGSTVQLVAVVHGPAVGTGGLLVALADVVVMSRTAWLSFPEARLGLPLGLSLLARFLPPRAARQLMATGDRIAADRLHALGAVDHLVDDEALDEVTDRVVGELLGLPQPMAAWLYATPERAERARSYRAELRAAVTGAAQQSRRES